MCRYFLFWWSRNDLFFVFSLRLNTDALRTWVALLKYFILRSWSFYFNLIWTPWIITNWSSIFTSQVIFFMMFTCFVAPEEYRTYQGFTYNETILFSSWCRESPLCQVEPHCPPTAALKIHSGYPFKAAAQESPFPLSIVIGIISGQTKHNT